MASSSSPATEAPSPQQSPQEQPQQAPEQQGGRVELAPLDAHTNPEADLDSGLEEAVRALQRGQTLGTEGDARGEPAQRNAEPAGAKDAAREAEGTDGSASDTKRAEPPTPKASQWASLNRREQEFSKKQQEFAKQKAEYEAQQAKIKNGRVDAWEALKAQGWENPDEFLEHLAQTGGKATPEQREIAELKAWKASQEREIAEGRRRQKEEAQAEEYRQSVAGWHKNIAQYIKDSDEHRDSLVALDGNEQKVFQVIQDHYQRSGEQLEFQVAAKQVNEALEAQLHTALRAITSSPRGKAIAEEIVGKLTPEKSGKLPPQSKGLTSSVRQLSSTDSKSDLTLDEALEQNAAWLRSQRGGRR